MKPEGKKRLSLQLRKDIETSSGVGRADQSVGYIVCFANAVELYQKKKIEIVSDVVALTIS